MTKKQIIILSISISLIVIVPFVLNFAKTSISIDSSDWANFATYFSGLIMPVLTIANLVILSNVNNSVKKLQVENTEIYKKIKQQTKKGEFSEYRVDVDRQETVEESLDSLEEMIKNVDSLLEDYASLVKRKDFETSQLAIPNAIARLDLQVAQLKVNIYKELYNYSGSPKHQEKFDQLSKEFVELHKNTYLGD